MLYRSVRAHAQGRRRRAWTDRRRSEYGGTWRTTSGRCWTASSPATYRAPPVRRVHIPKGDGRKTRPIGIPTFEDKVLQRAVVDGAGGRSTSRTSCDCSYGFRPGRSAHQALEALWTGLMEMGGGWVLEVDIQSFFDTLDHGHLRSFLDQTGARWCAAASDRQVAEGGRAGGRGSRSYPRPGRRRAG